MYANYLSQMESLLKTDGNLAPSGDPLSNLNLPMNPSMSGMDGGMGDTGKMDFNPVTSSPSQMVPPAGNPASGGTPEPGNIGADINAIIGSIGGGNETKSEPPSQSETSMANSTQAEPSPGQPTSNSTNQLDVPQTGINSNHSPPTQGPPEIANTPTPTQQTPATATPPPAVMPPVGEQPVPNSTNQEPTNNNSAAQQQQQNSASELIEQQENAAKLPEKDEIPKEET